MIGGQDVVDRIEYFHREGQMAELQRGLTENQVLDVAADQYDRVWARGPGSLTLVSQ
jgi:hypothetical protein